MTGSFDSAAGSVATFECGDVRLQCGAVLPKAWLTYQTFGTLSPDGDNAILIPTHFGGSHANSSYFVGSGRALDPALHFIVIPNLVGNGVSVSPSNVRDMGGDVFPSVSIADNVRLQHRLLEMLGVTRLQAVVGFSMGGVQAYHWAMLYPEMVERIAPICAAARASEHNRAFLRGMAAALTADAAWNEGRYASPPTKGLRAMALAWSAWPPSAHFYRNRLYRQLGYASLDDFLERYWVATYGAMDANNLLCQIETWTGADISKGDHFSGTFSEALATITAKAFVMPSTSDAYFPPEDGEAEAEAMRNAEYRPIRSAWGHWAGSGRNPEDQAFIDRNLAELLAS
jgi:homoserine O-acetyltransferase